MQQQVLLISGTDVATRDIREACASLSCDITAVEHVDAAMSMLSLNSLDAVIICEDGSFAEAIDACREMRRHTKLPIMLRCNRDGEDHLVTALTSGADEFVTTSTSSRVIAARLVKLIERKARLDSQNDGLLNVDGIVLDLESRTGWVGDNEIPLTRTEFEILSLLMSKPNRVFTRSEIINDVWRDHWYGDDHVLETHVSRLRKKIQQHGGPKLLTSMRGVGYRLRYAVPPAVFEVVSGSSS